MGRPSKLREYPLDIMSMSSDGSMLLVLLADARFAHRQAFSCPLQIPAAGRGDELTSALHLLQVRIGLSNAYGNCVNDVVSTVNSQI